jgi:hypothetical protein
MTMGQAAYAAYQKKADQLNEKMSYVQWKQKNPSGNVEQYNQYKNQ